MYMEMNKRSVSVVLERRKKKKRVRVVVCEYNGSVVIVYGDEYRSVSVLEELRRGSRGEKGIR